MIESMQSYHQPLTRLLSQTIETAHCDRGSRLRRAAEDAEHVVALDRALEDEPTRSIASPGHGLMRALLDYSEFSVLARG